VAHSIFNIVGIHWDFIENGNKLWSKESKKGKEKQLHKKLLMPDLIHLGDDNGSPSVIVDLERLIGKKAQKEREKTRRRQDQMSANLAEVINGMKEENKKSQDQRIEERQEYIRLTKEMLVFE
jgi:hypothetical protein